MVRNTEGAGLPHYYQFLTAAHSLVSKKMTHSHRCSSIPTHWTMGKAGRPHITNFSQLLTVYQTLRKIQSFSPLAIQSHILQVLNEHCSCVPIQLALIPLTGLRPQGLLRLTRVHRHSCVLCTCESSIFVYVLSWECL